MHNCTIKNFIYLSVFLLAAKFSNAQVQAKVQRQEIFFKVDSLFKTRDSVYVIINAGKNLGVEEGLLAKTYSRWISASSPGGPRDFGEIGFGWVTRVDKNKAVLVVDVYDKTDFLRKGDLIALNLNVPPDQYRSIFSELSYINVEFLDADNHSLYDLAYLQRRDSKKVEDSLLDVIIKDIKLTYEWVKDDAGANISTPLKGGRFNGKSVLDVMRDIDREALMGYLVFVKYFPGKYIGQNFKANETFATWVLNNAPYTKPDVYRALFPVYQNKEKLLTLLPEYQHDIVSSKLIASFSEEAISLHDGLKKKEALELLDFARALAYAINDTSGQAAFHFNNAQILQNEGKYTQAIEECNLSLKFSRLANKKEMELSALMKKAYCQYKVSQYASARKTLEEADEKIELYKKSIGASTYRTTMQKRYEYSGWINYEEGNFDLALKDFESAVSINNEINSYESRIKNAEYYSLIGRVLNQQGKPDEALLAFSKAGTVYKGVRDGLNYALVLNNGAYSQFKNGQYRESLTILGKAYEQLVALGDFDNAGYSQSLMGSAFWQLGKYDSSLLAHKASIVLRRRTENNNGQAFSWKELGELYLVSGLKKEALQAFDTAAKYYEAAKDLSGQASTFIKAGKVYMNDENYFKAAQLYEKARGVTPKTTVEALFNLGGAWAEIDREKAKKYFKECWAKSDSTGNTEYKFFASRSLSNLMYRDHEFVEGDKYYNHCVAISGELNTPFATAYTLALRGNRFLQQSILDSALKYYNAALAIYDTVSIEDKLWQLVSISDVYISKGNFSKAESLLKEAVAIARVSNNNLALGSTLQSLSFLYALLGDFQKGFQANDSSLQIFKSSGNILRLANTYVSRGNIYKGSGEYKRSIEVMLFADSIYKEEKTESYRHSVLNNIGVTYFNQADYEQAVAYFNESMKYIKVDVVNEDVLLVKGNIAECFYYLKKIKEAKAILVEIQPEAKKRDLNRIASGMAIVLGRIAYDENNLKEAAQQFEEARQYAETSNERGTLIETYTQLGKVEIKLNQMLKGYNHFKKAIEVAAAYRIASGWEAYYEMGVMFYNQQNFDSSINYFRSAVDQLNIFTTNVFGDDKAKKLFNNDPRKADLYFKLSYAYSKTNQPEKSFAFANLSSLAGLKELGGAQSVPGFEKETKKLEDLQQKKNALRASAEKQSGASKIEIVKQLEIAEKEYTNYLVSLVQKDEKFNSYYPQEANPNSFLKYKGDLPDDLAVVLYLLNNNNLMTFTLTNEKLGIQIDSLGKDATQLIKSFTSLAKRPEIKSGTGEIKLRAEVEDEEEPLSNISFIDASSSLYQLLIGGVADKIKGKKRICIIPNGILSNLPFQCLGKKGSDGAFNFIIEDHAIFYTNDISIFYKSKVLVPDKSDLHSFAAFGVPDATLRYNTTEVKEIGRIIGGQSLVYADVRATEGQAKKSLVEKSFVHFATHGILNYSQDFSQSYLKFLPDKDTTEGNNGQLTITEIQQLSMENCDLVTLSACETAVNKQLNQGWNISPANAFLLRRVKSVVASLWKVDDEATSILMNEFYGNLNKKMDKVDALRVAQVTLSKNPKYSHPFFWGAFVLYGEWR